LVTLPPARQKFEAQRNRTVTNSLEVHTLNHAN
jgi:hypothetical protein